MKLLNFIKQNIFLGILIAWVLLNLFVSVRVNLFSYFNYDFGKFDLGNMTQMVWNTLNGNFMYLTDYFGTDLPRWAMSHVDPILVLFVPFFAIFPHPLTLVFSQLLLVLSGAFIIYKLALLKLNSKFVAMLVGLSYLFYPAIGYLNARTGFHGVTAAIPFFMGAFYLFEKMYDEKDFSRNKLIIFWTLLVITMSGKEQLPLYIFFFALFILFFRSYTQMPFSFSKEWFKEYFSLKTTRLAVSMAIVSFLWFILAFFLIIPGYAHYRVEGYEKFANSLGINTNSATDVAMSNYFLSRYESLGDSPTQIIVNFFLQNRKAIGIFFGGDRLDSLSRTFAPVLYLPLAYPPLLAMAAPDFFINYLTSADGVGTSEIENHRISMIVPVMFISTIYAIWFFSALTKKEKVSKGIKISLGVLLLLVNIKTTFDYNNPVYLWLNQAVSKRLSAIPVFAKFDRTAALKKDVKIGDVLKVADLDNKDIECANKVVSLIPNDASVSGPDYLGAHLSMRETYAIFPALYNTADYVIVDVFSRKILTILDVDSSLIREVVFDLLKDPNYELQMGCGNLFVFKKVGAHGKKDLLPLQEKFSYPEKVNYEIFNGLYVVDYTIPQKIERGKSQEAKFVYVIRNNDSLNDYILYMTYLNERTGEVYQTANLPSFSIAEPEEWSSGYYYIETNDIALPKYLTAGKYRVFIGMSNKIRTRNLFLGETEVY